MVICSWLGENNSSVRLTVLLRRIELTPLKLSSLVVDSLYAHYQLSPNTGIGYIYCSYTKSHTSLEYIRVVIKQLCRKMMPLPPILNQVYEKHYTNDSHPTFGELQDLFFALIRQLDSVFFVLDALDECTLDQRKEIYHFFSEIMKLRNGAGNGIIKFFVTSRKESDIERAFLSMPSLKIEVKAAESDIERYVKAQIEQRLDIGAPILGDKILKKKIFTALTSKANGMYVLPFHF